MSDQTFGISLFGTISFTFGTVGGTARRAAGGRGRRFGADKGGRLQRRLNAAGSPVTSRVVESKCHAVVVSQVAGTAGKSGVEYHLTLFVRANVGDTGGIRD